MRERPILFNDAMVRAILSEAKTQTRRPVKLREFQRSDTRDYDFTFRDRRALWNDFSKNNLVASKFNPFGVPGDRLWVREAHAVTYHHAPDDYPHVFYRADGAAHQHDGRSVCDTPDSSAYKHAGEWTPSIHMPRWASRLTLRVKGVRVERVQDITEDDALAEGVVPVPFCRAGRPTGMEHVEAFEGLWRDTYGPESWEANPWVWVVSFERVTEAEAALEAAVKGFR